MAATDIGTGVAIVFGTSGFTAHVMAVNGQAATRESINSSHHGTATWHTFIPGDLSDPGELSMEINFDPDDQPPINGAAETVTITFPLPAGGTTAATLASSAFVTGWEWATPFEDKMTATITLKLSGVSTWTAST